MIKTLLFEPRSFFRNFENFKNEKHIILLFCLAGIVRSFDRAIGKNQGDTWELSSIILFSVIVGALLGWISFYIYGGLISLTSGWIGKSISTESAMQIMAYAVIPMVFSLLILAVQILIFGNQLFQSQIFVNESSFEFYLFNGLLLLQVLLSLYSLYLFIVGISEVHQVSFGRATLYAFLPALGILVIVAVVLSISALIN